MTESFKPGWRPISAQQVPLTDIDLAKLGLLTQLESQCKTAVMSSLKGLKQLSTSEWQQLDSRQFKQLVTETCRGFDD